MAIDDKVGILIKQAEEESENESYLPLRLTKLGISAIFAVALKNHQFASSVLANLLATSHSRFNERAIAVLKAMDEQHKRIEEKIEDEEFYHSEEFQTLIGLILERLHTTHDKEKLKMFGEALANSGTADFKSDDKEAYIRILRDLSTKDLQILNDGNLKGWLPLTTNIRYSDDVMSSLLRLAAYGLVVDRLHTKTAPRFDLTSRGQDISKLNDFLATPPRRAFHLSEFGKRFLEFIAVAQSTPA